MKNGIHCPNSPVQDPDFVQIGFPDLIEKRMDREVPVKPYGTLADYVPFYFTVRSPMLYVIAMGNDPEVIKTPQEEIIYLVSTVEKLNELGVLHVFTDRHAKLSYANFYNNYEDLGKLDWGIIRSDKWGQQYGPERKEIKQAECLVYKKMPIEAIIGIGCKEERIYNIVEEMVKHNKTKITVKIKQDWYF